MKITHAKSHACMHNYHEWLCHVPHCTRTNSSLELEVWLKDLFQLKNSKEPTDAPYTTIGSTRLATCSQVQRLMTS